MIVKTTLAANECGRISSLLPASLLPQTRLSVVSPITGLNRKSTGQTEVCAETPPQNLSVEYRSWVWGYETKNLKTDKILSHPLFRGKLG